MRKPRPIQGATLQWLRDLANNRDPRDRVRSSSQHGGSVQCKPALFRRGFVDLLGDITPAGRDYIAQLDRPKLKNVRWNFGGHQERMVDALDKKLGKPKEPKKP